MRRKNKITQEDFGDMFGINRATVSKYEKLESNITVDIADEMATKFNLTMDELCRIDLEHSELIGEKGIVQQDSSLAKEPSMDYIISSEHQYQIEDDSMMPMFYVSDYVIGIPINDIARIANNAIYIIETIEGTTVKRVKKIPEKNSLMLISENKLAGEPYEITWKDILKIMKVKTRITKVINVPSSSSS